MSDEFKEGLNSDILGANDEFGLGLGLIEYLTNAADTAKAIELELCCKKWFSSLSEI